MADKKEPNRVHSGMGDAESHPARNLSDWSSDGERVLFGSDNLTVENCRFEGPGDGEYPLQECRNCTVKASYFALRYPFWQNEDLTVLHTRLAAACRSPFWYGRNIRVGKSVLNGKQAFRECEDLVLSNCDLRSADAGWNCRNVTIGGNSRIESDRFLLRAETVHMRDTTLTGEEAFHYVRGGEIRDCVLNADNAFWHAEDLLVTDCVINGNRLGWFAKNLRFVRCRIAGRQPLCYCENLVLEDCSMDGCDLAFEYSDVRAMLKGNLESVRNPAHGSISADAIGEIILDERRRPESDCVIRTKT